MPDDQDRETQVKLTVDLQRSGDWRYFFASASGLWEQSSCWAPPWSSLSSRGSLLLPGQAEVHLCPAAAHLPSAITAWAVLVSGKQNDIHNHFFPSYLISVWAGTWVTGLFCIFRRMWKKRGFSKSEDGLRAHCWGVFVWVWQIQVFLCKPKPSFWKPLNSSFEFQLPQFQAGRFWVRSLWFWFRVISTTEMGLNLASSSWEEGQNIEVSAILGTTVIRNAPEVSLLSNSSPPRCFSMTSQVKI